MGQDWAAVSVGAGLGCSQRWGGAGVQLVLGRGWGTVSVGAGLASNPGSHPAFRTTSDEKLDESLGSRLGLGCS